MRMKVLVLILFPLLSLSQIVLTPLGLRDAPVNGRPFVEITCEGRTPEELFSSSLKYLNTVNRMRRNVILGQRENESIRFESYSGSVSRFTYVVLNYIVSCRYAVELTFRENKIRYEILVLDLEARPVNKPNDPNPSKLQVTGDNMSDFAIYKESSGKLLKPEVKHDLEKFFNNELKNFTAYLRDLPED